MQLMLTEIHVCTQEDYVDAIRIGGWGDEDGFNDHKTTVIM